MKEYRHLMDNYKKQLKDTGHDIISKVSIMIAENNKRIPEVVEMVYERKKAEERTEPAKSKE